MSQPHVGTGTATYAESFVDTETTVLSEAIARTITQSEAIAQYFHDDLKEFLELTGINLITYLRLPPDRSRTLQLVLEMLYNDLSLLLRDHFITGIHLLLCDPTLDANLKAFVVRYHARYVITQPERVLGAYGSDPEQRWGGRLEPPQGSWVDARFALLVDWAPGLTPQQRQRARREHGFRFDWVVENDRYDDSSLLQYHEGGLTVEGARVDRSQAAAPYLQRP